MFIENLLFFKFYYIFELIFLLFDFIIRFKVIRAFFNFFIKKFMVLLYVFSKFFLNLRVRVFSECL